MQFGEKKSRLSDAEEIPEPAKSLLPGRGLVFISGGLVSPGTRAVVDIDRKKIDYGLNKGGNSSPYGMLPKEGAVDIADLDAIISLANAVWASDWDFSNMPPIADFDVILILADGDDYKVIKSYGPPVGDVKKLYDHIWNLIPER